MRLCAGILVLVLQLPLAVPAATQVPEQTITPLPSDTQQRVEPLTEPAEQHVDVIDSNAPQHVSEPGVTGPIGRGAKQVAKVAVGVLAASVSIGMMVASLLFF